MTAAAPTPGQAASDPIAEEAKREFDNWFGGEGYDDDGMFDADEMEFAFESGFRTVAERAAQDARPAPDLSAGLADLESELRDVTRQVALCRSTKIPCVSCEQEITRAMGAVRRWAQDVAEHERTREPKPAPGDADVLDITGEVLTAAVQGKRIMLQLGSKPEPQLAPELAAAIRAHCKQAADEFSAEMFPVRPQDMRVSAADILAIVDRVQPATAVPGLAAAMAALATEMHAEAQTVTGSEPDGMPDLTDQVRAQVLHEYASRIRQALHRAGVPS